MLVNAHAQKISQPVHFHLTKVCIAELGKADQGNLEQNKKRWGLQKKKGFTDH